MTTAGPVETRTVKSVSVPHGHEGANVNVLTRREDLDPLTGMTRSSGVEVALEPVT